VYVKTKEGLLLKGKMAERALKFRDARCSFRRIISRSKETITIALKYPSYRHFTLPRPVFLQALQSCP
jgi:hypothetical protein